MQYTGGVGHKGGVGLLGGAPRFLGGAVLPLPGIRVPVPTRLAGTPPASGQAHRAHIYDCCFQEPEQQVVPKRRFRRHSSGREAYLWKLSNKNGMQVEITDYGGTIVSVTVPDGSGGLRGVLATKWIQHSDQIVSVAHGRATVQPMRDICLRGPAIIPHSFANMRRVCPKQ